MNSTAIAASQLALLPLIITAILLFVFFRVFHLVLPGWALFRNNKKITGRYLPLIEVFAWMLLLLWSIRQLWHNNQIVALTLLALLFILLGFFGWFGIKDLIAGVIFRSNRHFSEREYLRIGKFQGQIQELGKRHLVLETEVGETIHLPYSQLLSKPIRKAHPAENIVSHTIDLQIAVTQPLQQQISELQTNLLHLPWLSIKKPPQIKLIEEREQYFLFEVTIYSIKKEYFHKIEKYIRSIYHQ